MFNGTSGDGTASFWKKKKTLPIPIFLIPDQNTLIFFLANYFNSEFWNTPNTYEIYSLML